MDVGAPICGPTPRNAGRSTRASPTPVPGQPDVWNRVHLNTRPLGPTALSALTFFPRRALHAVRSALSRRDGPPLRGRRRIAIAALLATFAVVAGGTVAFGAAYKTVSVDVDGKVSRVTTYAGAVRGVLDDRGIEVGGRDIVAPSPTSALGDRSEIVVRHAKRVRVLIDGVDTNVWTTAVRADEALATLVHRGKDVRLVASRSASGGRAELPPGLRLDGPIDVAADGKTVSTDGSDGLAAALRRLGITLTALDRVSIQHPGTGPVTVVVNRVVVQEVTDTPPVPFAIVEQPDPARSLGTKAVATAGVLGQRTTVNRVTTVDGAETARTLLSDADTLAPVNQVVSVGTKKRVVAPAPAPKAAPSPAAAPSAPVSPKVGGSADSLNWAALAACEAGGRTNAVSSNGLYYGLYQFSVSTWAAVGGSGLPSQASADEQTARAKSLYARSGAGQWPVCGARLFS
jgi:uncharacterized protein YabE (DUF348 family)